MNAKPGTIFLAAQLNGLLHRLDKNAYTQALPLFGGGTIGQHVRHILECYQCLFDGLRRARVDYESRQRNTTLSDCPRAAQAVLDYIAHTVKLVDEHQWLHIAGAFPQSAAFPGARPSYLSSAGRELQYAFDHAVHHLAIIRMGLEQYFPELSIDPDLGVAPATIQYRKTMAASERVIPETVIG